MRFNAQEIRLNIGKLKKLEFWIFEFSDIWLNLTSYHRCDSIQGTDYIANYFALNLRVSRITIENLRWWFGGDIIALTFGKFVTLLVQIPVGSELELLYRSAIWAFDS